jgi:hypothetical protein
LVKKEPDVAFDLLNGLVNVGPDSATPSARPNWRDDDAGAGRGVTSDEQHGMLVAAADRLIACAKGNSLRLAKLLDKIRIFDPARASATFALVEEFISPAAHDEDKEIVRGAPRRMIHWQLNYGDLRGATLESHLARMEGLYERLAPSDPIDPDGVWPLEAVRDVLDRPELEKMRNGFVLGAMNKRGVTSRAHDEGGRQERELAGTYRGHARALHNSHVPVAVALEQLASWYENDGLREDLQARLRREGH